MAWKSSIKFIRPTIDPSVYSLVSNNRGHLEPFFDFPYAFSLLLAPCRTLKLPSSKFYKSIGSHPLKPSQPLPTASAPRSPTTSPQSPTSPPQSRTRHRARPPNCWGSGGCCWWCLGRGFERLRGRGLISSALFCFRRHFRIVDCLHPRNSGCWTICWRGSAQIPVVP